tara:strand:- start:62012 stop:63190 length:1179 start_codon:yes stop_codon:yes gene_type:complete
MQMLTSQMSPAGQTIGVVTVQPTHTSNDTDQGSFAGREVAEQTASSQHPFYPAFAEVAYERGWTGVTEMEKLCPAFSTFLVDELDRGHDSGLFAVKWLFERFPWGSENKAKDLGALIAQFLKEKYTKSVVDLMEAALLLGKGEDLKKSIAEAKFDLDYHDPDESNQTLLHMAAYSCYVELVQFLLEQGANVNAENKWGVRPLTYAAQHYDEEGEALVDCLLAAGANPNAKEKDGTALMHTILTDEKLTKSFLNFLVSKGFDLEIRDNDGWTPLHYAVNSGSRGYVKVLLSAGACIDAHDNEGRTPLHYAASNGVLDIAKLLRKRGASLEAKDEKGKTPLMLAEEAKQKNLIKLLRKGPYVPRVLVLDSAPVATRTERRLLPNGDIQLMREDR